MERADGISGLTKLFRGSLVDIPDGSSVVFIGSEAVCPPFAQLMAYSVRDRNMSFGFGARAIWDKCRKMSWVEGAGFQISNEPFDPSKSSVVVVLGGLAMPKFGCSVQDVNSFISMIAGHPKTIGLGFMDIFRRSGWDKEVRFDISINATMSAELI
ncbi:MAG TPA: DUF2124 family protein [Methanomassiliicoccales archaeon]|nr:DUF2124 family protein [Methanomassiliicoccales archaeon]